jgi:uncharacterized membrane protein (UPF0127 family)
MIICKAALESVQDDRVKHGYTMRLNYANISAMLFLVMIHRYPSFFVHSMILPYRLIFVFVAQHMLYHIVTLASDTRRKRI